MNHKQRTVFQNGMVKIILMVLDLISFYANKLIIIKILSCNKEIIGGLDLKTSPNMNFAKFISISDESPNATM
jgi:hypothetical protein